MSSHWDFVDACNPAPPPARRLLPNPNDNKELMAKREAFIAEKQKSIVKELHEKYTQDSKWDDNLARELRRNPAAVLEVVPNIIPPELFKYCIYEVPDAVLKFASERLTSEQFATCIDEAPDAALKYVSERLTSGQFDYCIEKDPHAAVKYASERLTPEQDYSIRRLAQTTPKRVYERRARRADLLSLMANIW